MHQAVRKPCPRRVFTDLTFPQKMSGSWISKFTMGSWRHYGFLDSRWVPGFTMASWYRARHGTEIFGTARILRARHGNIWHGTDHKGMAQKYLARHGSTRSWHGTARDIPAGWKRGAETGGRAGGRKGGRTGWTNEMARGRQGGLADEGVDGRKG